MPSVAGPFWRNEAEASRGELPLVDSGADIQKPVAVYGKNTSALFYVVNCFSISQVYNCKFKIVLKTYELE